MKVNIKPVERLGALIEAHLKKKNDDDETATMLALKPQMVKEFGVGLTGILCEKQIFHMKFIQAFAANLPPPVKPVPQQKPVPPPDFL
ncbi:MAG: hypothetical protein WCS94_15465 [Verrucomicrobiota bacterium]